MHARVFSSKSKTGDIGNMAKGTNGGESKDNINDALNIQSETIRHQLNYPRLKLIPIRIFSHVSIVLGAMSVIIQVGSVSF